MPGIIPSQSEDFMIETGELRRGSTIEIDGTLYQVIEVDHLKIGRGSAQVRMKLRDVRAGHIVDKSVQSWDGHSLGGEFQFSFSTGG